MNYYILCMGIVYLINIERTDLYKIGITRKTPQERLKSLQTGNPKKLVLADYYKTDIYNQIETVIHRRFKHKKYQPDDFEHLIGEWFELDNEDVKNFKNTCRIIEDGLYSIQKNSTLPETKRMI